MLRSLSLSLSLSLCPSVPISLYIHICIYLERERERERDRERERGKREREETEREREERERERERMCVCVCSMTHGKAEATSSSSPSKSGCIYSGKRAGFQSIYLESLAPWTSNRNRHSVFKLCRGVVLSSASCSSPQFLSGIRSLYLMQHGQPALLFLVPGTLAPG